MQIIEIPASIVPRKAFKLDSDEQHLVDFKPGIEVLPAHYADTDNSSTPVFYFVKRHEPLTPHWYEGGYECTDSNGAKRAFHLDALIVHPKYFKRKAKAEKIRTSKGTGKRGRPKMDPSLKKTPTVYVKTGGKRGRPKMDPALKKSIVYVKTGGKRGRPRKNS